MVSFLQVEGLSKSFGDRLLFSDVTFGVYEGDKIGIVARNGDGKSTFLNILTGREDYDSGNVVYRNGLRIGYLEQIPPMPAGMTAVEYAAPQAEPGSDPHWSGEDLARRMLTQFKITDAEMPLEKLSGGQAKRVALAKVLLTNPDMLILDEPTNHLDMDMIEWLENYLSRQRVTLLMVTHDRYFLDNVCSRIIEIDRQQIFSYDGNYDYYLHRRAERMENLTAELAKVKNLLRTELEWMRRQPQARGSKAKYRIDNFYQLQDRSRMNLSSKEVSLNVKSSYIGSKIFEAHNVSKSFGKKVILKDWSYTFARYEKVGIVGGNGAGKSTFIKLLLGELKPDSGHFDIGQTVRWGYYSQEGMTGFDESKKVIDAVREMAEEVRIDEKTKMTASAFLSKFLFTPETQQKYISRLSGGERRRLYLATVLMRSPNFLVLDEPTNDLDIMTLTVLEDYLSTFKGCVIVVSHDRFFLDRIADHIFVFKGDGEVKDFPGDYSTYRHCVAMEEKEKREREREESAKKQPGAQSASGNSRRRHDERRKLSFKERKEMEELEQRIEELTVERKELEESLSSGTLGNDEIIKAGNRVGEVISALDEAELRYLELLELEG
ncbi:MAG: ABC-F family ATP-binding cassette domain-containing protein [Candidatus Amulumruptor caecigallinarius]|nr:ABC-F family ATP-binding cassette domain-containing protein [Candidatus Amulumruptor caecigallinarius]